MSLRVVLYAEGGNETSGEVGLPPAPGTPLLEENLGSGHILVRRCLELARNLPAAAVRFEAPLRDRRGNVARGTALLHRETLRQLLSWTLAHKRPDLVVILVDGDEDPSRRARLEELVSDVVVSKGDRRCGPGVRGLAPRRSRCGVHGPRRLAGHDEGPRADGAA